MFDSGLFGRRYVALKQRYPMTQKEDEMERNKHQKLPSFDHRHTETNEEKEIAPTHHCGSQRTSRGRGRGSANVESTRMKCCYDGKRKQMKKTTPGFFNKILGRSQRFQIVDKTPAKKLTVKSSL